MNDNGFPVVAPARVPSVDAGRRAPSLRRWVAAAVAGAMLLSTPGPMCHQAFAQRMRARPGPDRRSNQPVPSVPSLHPIGRTFSAVPLLSLLPTGPASIGSSPPSRIPAHSKRLTEPYGEGMPPPGSVGKRLTVSQLPIGGAAFMGPRSGDGPPASVVPEDMLRPGLEDMRSPAAEKEWADRSFAALRGETRGSVAPAELATDAGRGGRADVQAPRPPGASLAGPDVGAGRRGPEAPPVPPGDMGAAGGAGPAAHLTEDFFGFRRVHGLKHDPAARPLAADADTPSILERLSRQFNIPLAEILGLADVYRLSAHGDRETWLSVHDAMQRANFQEFKHLDHQKYQRTLLGEVFSLAGAGLGAALPGPAGRWLSRPVEPAGFRRLANRSYPPGWRGAGLRAVELHKHLTGFFFRLPYHLFDMFFFGYFRRNISFEFFHRGEDFINLVQPGSALKHLEAALRAQDPRGPGLGERLKASSLARGGTGRLLWALSDGLAQFLVRRLTLAVFSAVAMGLIAPLAPFAWMSFSLTGVPGLGAALVGLSHSAPMAVSWLSEPLAEVAAKTLETLLGDLVVGRVLNTLALSSLLTFPSAMRQRLMSRRGGAIGLPPFLSREFLLQALATAASPTFFKQNLRSFTGLITVGAEIEGIMSYAGSVDGVFDPAFRMLTGHGFKLFHAVGAAIERPEGESPIPWGGAITWGNVLLYKLQNLAGFNLSDEIFHRVNALLGLLHPNPVSDSLRTLRSPDPGVSVAAALEQAASRRPVEEDVRFQLSKDRARMGERARRAVEKAGDFKAEAERASLRAGELRKELSSKEAELSGLQRESRPVTPEERAEYESALKELARVRDGEDIEAKLSQAHALKNPRSAPEVRGGAAGRLQELLELGKDYEPVLLPSGDLPGHEESLGLGLAGLKAVQEKLSRVIDQALSRGNVTEPSREKGSGGGPPGLDPELEKRITGLVGEIEALREEAKERWASREVGERMLSAENRLRNAALRERRSGKELFEFHKNLARLATVMDLAFSLNEIAAAQQAIAAMQGLLDGKLRKIDAAKKQAQQDKRAADKNREQAEGWRKDAQKDVEEDKKQQDDMEVLKRQAADAVRNIGGFRDELRALLARLDAEDAAGSSALAKYRERQAMLPTLADWKTNGKPGNPDYLNLKKIRADAQELRDNVRKLDEGMGKLNGVPEEFAGVLIVAVPGIPEFQVRNPTLEQTRRLLDERRAYLKTKSADIQKQFNEARDRLDPSHGGVETDDFGFSNPVSLPRWLAEQEGIIDASRSKVSELSSAIDALASNVNRTASGAVLPPLSGLTLKELQSAVESYADKLSALGFPNRDTDEVFRAKMDLLVLGKLLPSLGRHVIRWSEADVKAESIRKAMNETLPPLKAGLGSLVELLGVFLVDVDSDFAYLDGPRGPDQRQALIERKRALLLRARPVFAGLERVIEDKLIPFQQDAVKAVNPDNEDGYARLFKSQIKLYEAAQKALEKTLPWALAAQGAREGDKAGGMANIRTGREKYQKYLKGYTADDGTRRKGIEEYMEEVRRRKDAGFTGTEVLYGETQPFSLPRKIEAYGAERARRAAEYNKEAAEINDILGRIDLKTGNRFNLLSRFRLPTGISAAGGAGALQALVDNKTFQTMGDLLTQIGEEYKAKSKDPNLIDPDTGKPPEGKQPPIEISNDTLIALLSLQAGRRLVPSTRQDPASAAATYAAARFLFSDAVIASAEKALKEQIPAAEAFLALGKAALDKAIADLLVNETYVQSGGTSETGEQVVARSVAVYARLRDFTAEGVSFFGRKTQWDADALKTVDKARQYYDSLSEIGDKASTVADKETEAALRMRGVLRKAHDDLEASRRRVGAWMSQLNSKHESALKRVAGDLREIQEKTKAVLERNVAFREVQERRKSADETFQWTLGRIETRQRELRRILDRELPEPWALPPALDERVRNLSAREGSWRMDLESPESGEVLVIKKTELSYFIDQLFSMLKPEASGQNLGALRRELLQNPQNLANLIPNSKVVDFGDNADGFYLVYQTRFAVPHGLETSNWVTMGNLGKLWGNNISISGYVFSSPPNPENAPYGGKGVELQIESIQGKRWVNYMNIGLHRFLQDYPDDLTLLSNVKQTRLFVFEDFAALWFGDRLYLAATGFGDWALDDPFDRPSFYGGSFKTSVKFSEAIHLKAEQQAVLARDPREFFKTVNLDFTGLDQDLNRNFDIHAKGENKEYYRTQIGPSVDVGRLLKSQEAFVVDFYVARQSGTDDIAQNSGGVSVLKGFSIRDKDGKPWVQIQNRATGELGERVHTLSDRVSVALPEQGIGFNAEGRLFLGEGGAGTYYLEASKRLGDNTSASLSWGSRYAGMENRLGVDLNTSFTLGEMWRGVLQRSAEDLAGGEALKAYQEELDGFLKARSPDSKTVSELQAVYRRDVAGKLRSQEIGKLAREIRELRRAGAVLDNARVRGMIGFVSHPVGDTVSERAVGGGMAAGSQTELVLNKTQKAVIAARVQHLYREALNLQVRMIELTKEWQAALEETAQAQWGLELARFARLNAPSELSRREAEVFLQEANARYHQARIRYNMLAGRAEGTELPFDKLSPADLEAFLKELRRTLASPRRLGELFGMLGPEAMSTRPGEDSFNIVDWIPFIDRLTFSIGVQFQDALANQVIGAAASVRLPIYDPAGREGKNDRDPENAYVLEERAAIEQMRAAYDEFGLLARKEAQEAALYSAGASGLREKTRRSADALSRSIPAYRNGLIPERRLRADFARWRWYAQTELESAGRAALAEAWSSLDAGLGSRAKAAGAGAPLRSLEDALREAKANSSGLLELAFRERSSARMTQILAHRVQKATLDIYVGANLTASGVGWIPGFGITGIPVTPVLGFEFQPKELEALRVEAGKAQSELFRRLQDKVETNLAAQLAQNLTIHRDAGRMEDMLERSVLPELDAAFRRAEALGGEDASAEAGQAVEEARLKRDQMRLAREQAAAAINYLLGRRPDSGVETELEDPEALLEQLRGIFGRKDPVGTERAILEARLRSARAEQVREDKALKLEEIRTDVSLVVRSFSRLISALSEDGIGDPERRNAAHYQALAARRALDIHERELGSRRSQSRSALLEARRMMEGLRGRPDQRSRVEWMEWRQKERLLELRLAALDGSGREDAGPPGTAPANFQELKAGLRGAFESTVSAGQEPLPELAQPRTLTHSGASYGRYYYAHQTLAKLPIGRSFAEGWVELRLKSHDTPGELLLKLADLQTKKADRVHQNAVAQARARGDMLASRFELNVRLLRWLERGGRGPARAGLPGDFEKHKERLRARLDEQASEMRSLLGLPSGTGWEELARLVPADASGDAGDLAGAARRVLQEVESRHIDYTRRMIFQDGIPQSFGNEDNLANQWKADLIARRMGYEGFTPVAVFGRFRGLNNEGGFMEAPDPRAIERSLVNILSDSLRKELLSQGRMQELSARLHLLMRGVQDKAVLVERRQALSRAASDAVRSALLRVEKGLSGPDELSAAQDDQARAWEDSIRGVAELKNEFIELVTELGALGYAGKGQGAAAAFDGDDGDPEASKDPMAGLFEFWSRRMLDEGFAERLDAVLERASGPDPAVPEKLRRAAELYRRMSRNAEAVRHMDFTGPEKLELLTGADVEGRRLALEALLRDLWGNRGGRDSLVALLRRDLEGLIESAGAERDEGERLLAGLRDAYWHAGRAPPAVEAAFRRLEGLRKEESAARQELLERSLADPMRPEQFVLRDRALDRHVRARRAFHAEIVKTFQSRELRENEGLALALDGLYDLRGAIAGQMELARYGSAMASLNALLWVEESRLAALRYDRALPARLDEAYAALQRLRETKERWLKDPPELAPLHALLETDAQGRRAARAWLSDADLGRAPYKDGIRTDEQGRRWFRESPQGPEREIVSGVDMAGVRRGQAAGKHRDNLQALERFKLLENSDFALLALDGTVERGVSFAELKGWEREGRVFLFDREPEGGARRALHPLQAAWKEPGKVEILVYSGAGTIPPDRLPVRESLESLPEAGGFKRLELGEKGAQALAAERRELRLRSLRRGWILIKLSGHGFAVDEGGPVELYPGEKEFKAALESLRRAPKDVEKARKELEAAKAGLAGEEPEFNRLKDEASAASDRLRAFEKELRSGLEPRVRAELGFPETGSLPPDGEQRLRDALNRAVAQDGRFQEEQKTLAAAVRAFKKADGKHQELLRKAEEAAEAIRGSELWLLRSKSWRLFETRDLALGLDGKRDLVQVSAPAVYGGAELRQELGRPQGSLSLASGKVYAAVMGPEGTLRRLFMTREEVEGEGEGWTIQAIAGGEEGRLWPSGGGKIDPNFRLKHYIDPGTGLPVLLHRDFLEERGKDSESRLKESKYWGLRPRNWINLLLEPVRSLVKTPLELLTGEDPNQQHYLGMVNAHKLEGGMTRRRGALENVLRTMDVLDLVPDPVERAYDPTQLPEEVRARPIRPGENIYRKDAHTLEKDVHFGKDFIWRHLVYQREDLDGAGSLALGHFDGGVRTEIAELRRGRDPSRFHESSRVEGRSGMGAVRQALGDLAVAADPNSDGSGVVRVQGEPGHVEVERVVKRVELLAGAGHQGKAAELLEGHIQALAGERVQAAGREEALRAAAAETEREYRDRLLRREQADEEERLAWDRAHRWAWRVQAQAALQDRMRDLREEIAGLKKELEGVGKTADGRPEAGEKTVPAPARSAAARTWTALAAGTSGFWSKFLTFLRGFLPL